MHIIVNEKVVFTLLDTLLSRWTATPKQFPYDRPDAIIPQTVIPEALREDTLALTRFYFYICIYMRGGIESLQAFRAVLRMREDHPNLFDPFYVQWMTLQDVQTVIKQYVGWDSKEAATNWIENSKRLVRNWRGDPRKLMVGLRTYDEALRRIRNKLTRRERTEAGLKGEGFRGFQAKMVSMLLYFFDWEGLLPVRFLYPAPADFHNFRLALAHRGIRLEPEPRELRASEKLSFVWRAVVMKYLRSRKADPVEVADAIWLFSLVLCGNSPITQLRTPAVNGTGMFTEDELPHQEEHALLAPRYREAIKRTCLACPLIETCELSIPAGPYYQRGEGLGGKLVLRTRFRIEDHVAPFADDASKPKVQQQRPDQQSELYFLE